jgi:hypothetical protein
MVGEARLAVETADAGAAAAGRGPLLAGRGEKTLCRSNTGHMSGSPGSLRRLRAGSVIIVCSFSRTVAGSFLRKIALPYDFDILRPSVLGIRFVSVSSVCGSGKTSP